MNQTEKNEQDVPPYLNSEPPEGTFYNNSTVYSNTVQYIVLFKLLFYSP